MSEHLVIEKVMSNKERMRRNKMIAHKLSDCCEEIPRPRQLIKEYFLGDLLTVSEFEPMNIVAESMAVDRSWC